MYILLNMFFWALIGFLFTKCGTGPDDWQFWAINVCIGVIHIVGYLEGRKHV